MDPAFFGAGNFLNDPYFTLAWTKPNLWLNMQTDQSGALFKTSKILNGRALAADAFIGAISMNPLVNPTNRPTSGTLPPLRPGCFAHKVGYNVLYGDSSVRWYGDPKQQFAWWFNPTWASALTSAGAVAEIGNQGSNIVCEGYVSPGPGMIGTSVQWENGSTTNTFDLLRQAFSPASQGYGQTQTYLWHLMDMAGGMDSDAQY
jgi:hypothetical protein